MFKLNYHVVEILVIVAVAASIGQMLAGNDERAVLFCLWGSLILGLYGVSK